MFDQVSFVLGIAATLGAVFLAILFKQRSILKTYEKLLNEINKAVPVNEGKIEPKKEQPKTLTIKEWEKMKSDY